MLFAGCFIFLETVLNFLHCSVAMNKQHAPLGFVIYRQLKQNKKKIRGLGHSLVLKLLPSMNKALDVIQTTIIKQIKIAFPLLGKLKQEVHLSSQV